VVYPEPREGDEVSEVDGVLGVHVGDEDSAQHGDGQPGLCVLGDGPSAAVDDVHPVAHDQGNRDAGASDLGRRPARDAEQHHATGVTVGQEGLRQGGRCRLGGEKGLGRRGDRCRAKSEDPSA
jgi:hypothetical protein